MKSRAHVRKGTAFRTILLVLLVASGAMLIAPVSSATTPQLDCGRSSCPETVGSASGGSNHAIAMSVTLSTSNSPDLIVVIVTGDATKDSPQTPSLSGVSFTSICTSSSTPTMEIYAGEATTALSGATVTETEGGGNGGSTGGMVAFGISGYDYQTTSPLDGSCTSTTGNSASSSLGISGLTDGNDFIFAGVASSGGSLSATGSTTLIGATTSAVYSAGGFQLGGGGGSYTLTFSSSVSGAWNESVVAIKDSSPASVPIFPAGIAPVILAITLIYFLESRRGRQKEGRASGRQK